MFSFFCYCFKKCKKQLNTVIENWKLEYLKIYKQKSLNLYVSLSKAILARHANTWHTFDRVIWISNHFKIVTNRPSQGSEYKTNFIN